MKKFFIFLFFLFYMISFGQSYKNFEIIEHKPNSNVQLKDYNVWIDQTKFDNWATVVDSNIYISSTFQEALQILFITKLKTVRKFTLYNNKEILTEVTYDKKTNKYLVIFRQNYNTIYKFDNFYGVNDYDGKGSYPTSVRGMVNEFLIESIKFDLLYNE